MNINGDKLALWIVSSIITISGVILTYFYWQILKPDPMLSAAQIGDVVTMRQLINKGANIYTMDGWGSTPMMYAAVNCQTSAVELLLAHGVTLNGRSPRMGRTPLAWAALKGCGETVQFLLKKGADVSIRDDDGKTALMLAEENGHTAVVELLKSAKPSER